MEDWLYISVLCLCVLCNVAAVFAIIICSERQKYILSVYRLISKVKSNCLVCGSKQHLIKTNGEANEI